MSEQLSPRKKAQRIMLRVGEKKTVLVGEQTSAVTMEISTEISQTIKSRTTILKKKVELPFDLAVPLLGIHPKDSNILPERFSHYS